MLRKSYNSFHRAGVPGMSDPPPPLPPYLDYAKKLKLRFRVGDLDEPERRKRYTSSRENGVVDAHMRPCDTTIENRTRIVGESGIYKEEWDMC